jgi:2-hydroxychromene-2-carboxylate isomerase
MSTASVEFYFDPACPWTWNTSRWLVEVAQTRGLDVQWRPLSLAFLNADREIPEQYRAPLEAGLALLRIVAASRVAGRDEAIADLYTEFGRRFFHDQEPPSASLAVAAAEAVGLGALADAAADASYDDAILTSTQEAIERAGPDVGSPVLIAGLSARAFHGPIVSPPPRGEDALRLWDAVVTLTQLPGVYEIKHGRADSAELGSRP